MDKFTRLTELKDTWSVVVSHAGQDWLASLVGEGDPGRSSQPHRDGKFGVYGGLDSFPQRERFHGKPSRTSQERGRGKDPVTVSRGRRTRQPDSQARSCEGG